MSRWLKFWYVVDMLVLAIVTLGKFEIGETLSSVAWSLETSGKLHGHLCRCFIDWLFSGMESDHCQSAYQTYLRITGQKK